MKTVEIFKISEVDRAFIKYTLYNKHPMYLALIKSYNYESLSIHTEKCILNLVKNAEMHSESEL